MSDPTALAAILIAGRTDPGGLVAINNVVRRELSMHHRLREAIQQSLEAEYVHASLIAAADPTPTTRHSHCERMQAIGHLFNAWFGETAKPRPIAA